METRYLYDISEAPRLGETHEYQTMMAAHAALEKSGWNREEINDLMVFVLRTLQSGEFKMRDDVRDFLQFHFGESELDQRIARDIALFHNYAFAIQQYLNCWENDWERHVDFCHGTRPLKIEFMEELVPSLSPQLGNVVVDLGSGRYGVSHLVRAKERRIVQVDIAAPETASFSSDILRVRLDIEEALTQPPSENFSSAARAIGSFLECENPDISQARPFADSFILSDILNYVDYQEVLRLVGQYLKPGGLVCIHHDLGAYSKQYLSEKRPRSHTEIVDFLNANGFRIILQKEMQTRTHAAYFVAEKVTD